MKNKHNVIIKKQKSNYKIDTQKSIYTVITNNSNNSVITLFSFNLISQFILGKGKRIRKKISPFLTVGVFSFLFSINVLAQIVSTQIEQTIPLKNGQLDLFNQPEQGNFVYGKITGDGRLFLNNQKIIPNSAGYFIFSIPQDAPQQIELTLKKWGRNEKIPLTVTPRQWHEEVVNGLQSSKVHLSPENQKRVQTEHQLVKTARQSVGRGSISLLDKNNQSIQSDIPFCFTRPVHPKARISSAFGSKRILNGVKKRGHSGTDYALPLGSTVSATQDGIVLWTHPDLFYSGKTILIDHGYGIVSSYSHLNQIDVRAGDVVRSGQKIGTIGTTGRSTGPHLHFVLGWQTTRVDPERVLRQFQCPAE